MSGLKSLATIFLHMVKTSKLLTTAEKPVSKTKVEIIKEAKRIEEATLISAKGHFEAARIWGNFHLVIGIPTVLLSAVAGTSAVSTFNNSKIVAGVLSILVAAFSALMTFLNPNEKASIHLNSGNKYDALQNKVRLFWSIDCWKEESEEILTEKIRFYSDEKSRLNSSCPQVPWIGYLLAKKGIERGEADYKIDKATVD